MPKAFFSIKYSYKRINQYRTNINILLERIINGEKKKSWKRPTIKLKRDKKKVRWLGDIKILSINFTAKKSGRENMLIECGEKVILVSKNPTKHMCILVPTPLCYIICTNFLQVCRKGSILELFALYVVQFSTII